MMWFKNVLGILFICLICYTQKVLGQDLEFIYGKVHLADSLLAEGLCEKSNALYKVAFDSIKTVPLIYLKKGLVAADCSDSDSIKNKISEQIKVQQKGRNEELKHFVDSLIKVDQANRSNKNLKQIEFYRNCRADTICNRSSKKFIDSKNTFELAMETDSMVIKSLLTIIGKYGYIGEEMVGGQRAVQVHLIMLHFDSDSQNVVLEPILFKALNQGLITPLQYAQVIDRHLLSGGRLQKYWTWFYRSETEINLSKEDIKKVMEERAKIGIFSLRLQITKTRGFWIIDNKF